MQYRVETLGDFGWSLELDPFTDKQRAEHEARRLVYPFWPASHVRIVEARQ